MRLFELLMRQGDETIARLAGEHLEPGEGDTKTDRCLNLENVLRSPRHVRMTLYNRRPPCFWIMQRIIDRGGGVPAAGLKELALRGTAELVEIANSGQHGGRREAKDLYRRVLAEAWRSDFELDPSEISLLGVLRHELGLRNVDHFLIEHHSDLHPFWDTDHAFLDVLNGLRSSGLCHVVEGDLVLPPELQNVVRQVLGVEAGTSSCRRLYERLNSTQLASVLDELHMKSSGSKEERIRRLLDAYVQPTVVLDSHNGADLKSLAGSLGLKTSGSKDALVDRLLHHFSSNADLAPPNEPPPPPEREPRALAGSQFRALFRSLRGQDLSDILAAIGSARVTGTKEHLIELVEESPFSESTLLRNLENRQLEAILKRLDLKATGNKSSRVERIVGCFAELDIEASGSATENPRPELRASAAQEHPRPIDRVPDTLPHDRSPSSVQTRATPLPDGSPDSSENG